MAKLMKFERKQKRDERKAEPNLTVDEVMPPPGEPEAVVKESITPEAPKPAAKPKPQANPMEQIASYVRSMDWGRLKATARKAVESGMATDDQIDQAIDGALPPAAEVEQMPLHHVMAIASVATPEKRQEYAPILASHLEHAKNLPQKEQGEVQDHLRLIGFMENLAQ